jgi:hypothetical protein
MNALFAGLKLFGEPARVEQTPPLGEEAAVTLSLPVFQHRYGAAARSYFHLARAWGGKALALARQKPMSRALVDGWQRYRQAGRMLVDQARLMYEEGIESLIKEPVTVEFRSVDGSPTFICYVGSEGNGSRPSFRAYQTVRAENEAEQSALQKAFGTPDAIILDAFAEGLRRLERLGAFCHEPTITFQPDRL